jgi:hypothetical protein
VFNFDLECGSHLAGKFREEGLAGLRLAPDCSLSAPAQRPTRSQLQTAKSSVSRIHLSIPQAKRLGSGGTQSEQWHICVKFWGPIYFETAARPSNTPTRPSATHQGDDEVKQVCVNLFSLLEVLTSLVVLALGCPTLHLIFHPIYLPLAYRG